jgi:hypothetical protein
LSLLLFDFLTHLERFQQISAFFLAKQGIFLMIWFCIYLIISCGIFENSFVVHKGVLILNKLDAFFGTCISKYPCVEIHKPESTPVITDWLKATVMKTVEFAIAPWSTQDIWMI